MGIICSETQYRRPQEVSLGSLKGVNVQWQHSLFGTLTTQQLTVMAEPMLCVLAQASWLAQPQSSPLLLQQCLPRLCFSWPKQVPTTAGFFPFLCRAHHEVRTVGLTVGPSELSPFLTSLNCSRLHNLSCFNVWTQCVDSVCGPLRHAHMLSRESFVELQLISLF